MSPEQGSVNQQVVDSVMKIYNGRKGQILEEKKGWTDFQASKKGFEELFHEEILGEEVALEGLNRATSRAIARLLIKDNVEVMSYFASVIESRDFILRNDMKDRRTQIIAVAVKRELGTP